MKYYSVNYIDGRNGLEKNWCTWDDPNREDYRGHLDTILRYIHLFNGEILSIDIIEEE